MAEVIAALQSSLQRADRRMTVAEEAGGLGYAVTEFKIEFPAEVHVDKGQEPLLRFPRALSGEVAPEPASHLSRLVFTLRPVPLPTGK